MRISKALRRRYLSRGLSAPALPVYVNNNLIGKIGIGGELRSAIPVGAVRVRSNSNTVTIQALQGIEYKVEVNAPMQMFMNEPDFEVRLVNASSGAPVSDAQMAPVGGPIAPPPTPRPVEKGAWIYAAQKVAQGGQCAAEPKPQLTGKGPGFETYVVPCFSGDVLNVRCEFGQCRALK